MATHLLPRLHGHAAAAPAQDTAVSNRDYAIEAHSLTKTYGTKAVLDGVSLQIERGSIFGLVGPNGAGKTTLLSILAGLRKPSSGSFSLGSKKLAVLPDTPSFEPWLTAYELVDLARALVDPESAQSQRQRGTRRDRTRGGDERTNRRLLSRNAAAAGGGGQPRRRTRDHDDGRALFSPRPNRPPGHPRPRNEPGRQAHDHLFEPHPLLRAGRLRFSRHEPRSLADQGRIETLLRDRIAPTFIVELRGDSSAAAETLRQQPWVREVSEPARNQIAVSVDSIEAAEKPLVQVLATLDVGVRGIRLGEVSLEDVFLELTR